MSLSAELFNESRLYSCLLLELVDEGKIDKDRLIDYLLLSMEDQRVLEVMKHHSLTDLIENQICQTI